MAHGCPNYEELTPEREALRRQLAKEAAELYARIRAAGFVLRVERVPCVPFYEIGNSFTRIRIDVERRMAVPK